MAFLWNFWKRRGKIGQVEENISKNFLKTVEDRIDDQLITFSGVLLAAVLLISKSQSTKSVSYLVIGCVFCLIFTVLSTLWYKKRNPIRAMLFERKKEQIIENYSRKIANFAEKIILPLAKFQYGHVNKEKMQISPSQILKSTEPEQKSVIESFLRNLQIDMKEAHDQVFNRPLSEKYSKPKYLFDNVVRVTRYYVFVIGVVLFFASIILGWL